VHVSRSKIDCFELLERFQHFNTDFSIECYFAQPNLPQLFSG